MAKVTMLEMSVSGKRRMDAARRKREKREALVIVILCSAFLAGLYLASAVWK